MTAIWLQAITKKIWTVSQVVLVLAEVELIFFTAASVGLCFRFVLKTVLVTQGCFNYCQVVLTQGQGLFCFSPRSTSEWAGGAQEAGRGHGQDSWPKLTTGISQTIWHHAQHIKPEEGGGRVGCLEGWRLPSQGTIMHDGALLSWTWLNTCLLMGSNEWIPCFALLACMAFALAIKLSLSQPTSFLTYTLLILSLIPLWGSQSVAVWCLVVGWG